MAHTHAKMTTGAFIVLLLLFFVFVLLLAVVFPAGEESESEVDVLVHLSFPYW